MVVVVVVVGVVVTVVLAVVAVVVVVVVPQPAAGRHLDHSSVQTVERPCAARSTS